MPIGFFKPSLEKQSLTCFVYFNRRLGQSIRFNFGLEVLMDLCYNLLHPVKVLTGITALGVGGGCRSRVCLDTGHDKKHLDEARDGELQRAKVEGIHCAAAYPPLNDRRVVGNRCEYVVTDISPAGCR